MSIFNQNAKRKVRKNKFNLSHEHKTTTEWGKLTPFYLQEILPGDSFRVDTEMMIRLAPLMFPTMHRVNIYTHFFYVPNRILWKDWEDFIRGGDSGEENPTPPQVNFTLASSMQEGSLANHLGLPAPKEGVGPTIDVTVNELPFRAFNAIYNNWYRDQDIQSEIDIDFELGGVKNWNDNTLLYTNKYRNWKKDYFTSARPRAQKGQPVTFFASQRNQLLKNRETGALITGTPSLGSDVLGKLQSQAGTTAYLETQTLVSEIRRAEAMQSYLERLQRTGNRYREYLAGIWGVQSSDARIDIPEFLGGGKTPVTVSEVLQTENFTESGTSTGIGVGEMYGHGIAVGQNHGFKRSFEEHGFVIGIMSVLPEPGYYGGAHKQWFRTSRFDYYLPDFALIGEQPIEKRELYLDHTDSDSNSMLEEFGYQQRYAEYKHASDMLSGEMSKASFSTWHLTKLYTDPPVLNTGFLEVKPNDTLNRIFQVTDYDSDPFWIQIYNQVSAIRPIPYESIPDLT